MGCSGSKAPPAAPAPFPLVQAVDGKLVGGGKAKGVGKGVRKGKGKGGNGFIWQIKLEDQFQDYCDQEDRILKRAYMTGQKNAKFSLRGQHYEYNFRNMIQKNLGTHKTRTIRPPCALTPPSKPLLPSGPMITIAVRAGQPGTTISVKDPNNAGQMIDVFVPAHAKVGQMMAVPIPAKGESVEAIQKKQRKHDEEHGTTTSPWTTGGKMAVGGAAVAGVAAVGVGGVILGDHLAGGSMAADIGAAAVDAGEAIADGAGDAVDAIGDWAPGAAEAAGDWVEGAVDDVGDWAADAGDWLGDAGEDIGDFVMDLF